MKFFDSTLRDGNHAVKQQLSLKNIADYCDAIDDCGMYTVIIGHGNGLGASTINVGLAAESDEAMISAARERLKHTKLGIFLIPGFGTIKENLNPAFEQGVDLVCVASHCTEADITREHIQYARNLNKDVYGILMLQHLADNERITEEARKMESYGAEGVILMDSAGASLPESVEKRCAYMSERLSIPIGFHAHNNLGLAVANSLAAINGGAKIIDGTVMAFGAGAGNAQLEAVIAVMEKLGVHSGVNLYGVLDAAEKVLPTFTNHLPGVSDINLVSGLFGVFSSYAPHAKTAAENFGIDYRDLFAELGRRNLVGGQEDVIVEAAALLANNKGGKTR